MLKLKCYFWPTFSASFLDMKSWFEFVFSNAGSLIDHFTRLRKQYDVIYFLSVVYLLLFPLGCGIYTSAYAYESMGLKTGSVLLFRWFFFLVVSICLLLIPKKSESAFTRLRRKVRQPVKLYWFLIGVIGFIILFPLLQYCCYGMKMAFQSYPVAVYALICSLLYWLFYCVVLRLYNIRHMA